MGLLVLQATIRVLDIAKVVGKYSATSAFGISSLLQVAASSVLLLVAL